MKRCKFLIIPIVVIIIFSIMFNGYLNKEYETLTNQKDITSIKHTYNQIVRDRGGVLKDKMRADGDLMLLGSSELSSPVDQNPTKMFPFSGAEYDVSIYGKSYTQSLQHATILNSTKNLEINDKIAIVISAQWFAEQAGIEGNEFLVNFSELQFYSLFNNKNISEENKKYYANRISQLLGNIEEYEDERIYANLYCKNNVFSKVALILLKPYYNLRYYMFEVKDKVQAIKVLKGLEDKKEEELKRINWDGEYEKAYKQGEEKVTNNDICVEDNYYNKYLRDIYDSLKGNWNNVNLLESKEVQDYEFLLKVCKENNVKPLIILMPVNGLYYDHLGLSLESRIKFYNTLEEMANSYGFDALNLQSKEYEKYYMYDVMHLGWKGWLNINEEMYKYFNKK